MSLFPFFNFKKKKKKNNNNKLKNKTKSQFKKKKKIALTQNRVLKNIKNYQPKVEMQEK